MAPATVIQVTHPGAVHCRPREARGSSRAGRSMLEEAFVYQRRSEMSFRRLNLDGTAARVGLMAERARPAGAWPRGQRRMSVQVLVPGGWLTGPLAVPSSRA